MEYQKYQKALDIIGCCSNKCDKFNCQYNNQGHCKDRSIVNDNLSILQELIILNTPTNPSLVYEDEPLCPNCGELIEEYDDHCEECDQRIDWSE